LLRQKKKAREEREKEHRRQARAEEQRRKNSEFQVLAQTQLDPEDADKVGDDARDDADVEGDASEPGMKELVQELDLMPRSFTIHQLEKDQRVNSFVSAYTSHTNLFNRRRIRLP
jgi:hypothetical protein